MRITMHDAVAAYRTGNDAGRGYEVEGETVEAAVASLVARGCALVLDRRTSDEVAVLRYFGGALVAIGGDALGRKPWAVDIDVD